MVAARRQRCRGFAACPRAFCRFQVSRSQEPAGRMGWGEGGGSPQCCQPPPRNRRPPCSHPSRRHPDTVACFPLHPREPSHARAAAAHGAGQGCRGGWHPSTPAKGIRDPRPERGAAAAAWQSKPCSRHGGSGQQEDGLCRVSVAVLGCFIFDPPVLSRAEGAELGCGAMSSCSVTVVGGEGWQSEGELVPKPAQLVRFSAARRESSPRPPPGTRAAVAVARAVLPVVPARSVPRLRVRGWGLRAARSRRGVLLGASPSS